jgi:replicative DNA helicase
MDVERALLTKAFQVGDLETALGAGIELRHFMERPTGEKATPAEVFEWSSNHARTYGHTPSAAIVAQNWPDWRPEPVTDTIEELVDEFRNEVKRRLFESKLVELAGYGERRDQRYRLDELMLDAARDLASIVPSGGVERMSDMKQRIDDHEAELAAGIKRGLDMGIPLFDEMTYGVNPGMLMTIAGFSGRGKSALSTWIGTNLVEQDATVLMLSLEMTRREILERVDTMIMNFSSRSLNRYELTDAEITHWRRIAGLYAQAKGDMIVVDKLAGCTIDRLYAEINRYKPDVTIVDYIQRIKGLPSQRNIPKHEIYDEAANDLKSIAIQTDSAVILCSQDNRGAADTGSTETSTAGSVGIYQASNVYIGMAQNELMRERKQLELRLLKNRRGANIAEHSLFWEPDRMIFRPWRGDMDTFQKAPA